MSRSASTRPRSFLASETCSTRGRTRTRGRGARDRHRPARPRRLRSPRNLAGGDAPMTGLLARVGAWLVAPQAGSAPARPAPVVLAAGCAPEVAVLAAPADAPSLAAA